jgi:hypothetical protein
MNRKSLDIKIFFAGFIMVFFFSGCYKLQKDYNYEKKELDPHINMSAKDYLLLRGTAAANNDTVFKWMQKGIEYAGIDLAEYEKPGRTYIFLHNSAIKTVSSGKTNGGFFFDYPVVVKDALGNPIKSKIDITADSVRPANNWNEYPQDMVKNYFLYLIVQGEYGFDNLTVANQALTTLMPAGTVALAKDSKLGYVITKTAPNPDITSTTFITFSPTGGTGFDPEGKMNLKITNNDQSPITVNDRTNDRSAGYIATNGQLHVFGATVHPFRYSY